LQINKCFFIFFYCFYILLQKFIRSPIKNLKFPQCLIFYSILHNFLLMNNEWEFSHEATECRLNYLSCIACFLLRVNILHVSKLPEKLYTFVATESQRHTQQEHTYTEFTSSNAPRNLIKFDNPLSSFFANYKLIMIRVKSLTLYIIYCK